jgi:hypothetical protein
MIATSTASSTVITFQNTITGDDIESPLPSRMPPGDST